MGFGHRVYKSYDPRAKVMRRIYEELHRRNSISRNDPLFELAKELERLALEDDYFVLAQAVSERRLLLRPDHESDRHPDQHVHGDLRTSRGRSGWLSHWKEMIEDPDQRITRPRQLYVGPAQRPYADIARS